MTLKFKITFSVFIILYIVFFVSYLMVVFGSFSETPIQSFVFSVIGFIFAFHFFYENLKKIGFIRRPKFSGTSFTNFTTELMYPNQSKNNRLAMISLIIFNICGILMIFVLSFLFGFATKINFF